MPWFVYILRCGDGSLYTGVTTGLAKRLAAHRRGRGSKYTRARRPLALVYLEARRTRSTALRREAAIKRLRRPDKLRLLAGGPSVPAGLRRRAATQVRRRRSRSAAGRPLPR